MTVETINSLTLWMEANPLFFLAILIWTFVWKGLALWKSAELRQPYWFTAILIINTLGILEIIYLLIYRHHSVEVVDN